MDKDGDEGRRVDWFAGESYEGSGASSADEEPFVDEAVEGSGEGDPADAEGACELGLGGEAGAFGDGAGADEPVEVEPHRLVGGNAVALPSETLCQQVVW